VPNLGCGVTQLLNLAVASLPDKADAEIGIARHHSCRQHPVRQVRQVRDYAAKWPGKHTARSDAGHSEGL